jgi:hypothetical protein
MEPYAVSPPTIPSTLQVTPVFELPVTVAAYCAEVPSVTLVAPLNVRVTGDPAPLLAAASVIARLCETDGSTALVAVMVIFDDAGSFAGAV